jgi:hypothetical protein
LRKKSLIKKEKNKWKYRKVWYNIVR